MEADAVVDRDAGAWRDFVDREAHCPHIERVAIRGASKRDAVDLDDGRRRHKVGLVELGGQQVRDLHAVGRRETVVAAADLEVHGVARHQNLVGRRRRAAAGHAACRAGDDRAGLRDCGHRRLENLNALGGRQAGRVHGRVAARIGERGGVVAQDRRRVVDTDGRVVGDDARDVADHQRVDRGAVVARHVLDVAEVPAQRGARSARRGGLRHHGVVERGATRNDREAFKRHAGGQHVADDDAARRVFLQVQRQFIGDGVADADDGVRRACGRLGVGVERCRLADRRVVGRLDLRRHRGDTVVVQRRRRASKAVNAGALRGRRAIERGPVGVDRVLDRRAGHRDDRYAVRQDKRLTDVERKRRVVVVASPDGGAVDRRGRGIKTADRHAVDRRRRHKGAVEHDACRQRIGDVQVVRLRAARVRQGDDVLEHVADHRGFGGRLAGGRDELHGLGRSKTGLDDGHRVRRSFLPVRHGARKPVGAVIRISSGVGERAERVLVGGRVLEFDRQLDLGLLADQYVNPADGIVEHR